MGAIAPAISPLTPAFPLLDTDKGWPKRSVSWMGKVGGMGRGGGGNDAPLSIFDGFEDRCSDLCKIFVCCYEIIVIITTRSFSKAKCCQFVPPRCFIPFHLVKKIWTKLPNFSPQIFAVIRFINLYLDNFAHELFGVRRYMKFCVLEQGKLLPDFSPRAFAVIRFIEFV